jgi:hypothetical protein
MRNLAFALALLALGAACSASEEDDARSWDPEIVSGRGGCTKQTCATLGKTCGQQDDGCGGKISCGPDCVESACVPKTCEELAKTCGKHDDACGGLVDCGACATCAADAKEPNNAADAANDLGRMTDAPATTKSVAGLSVGDGDEDWFSFAVADTGLDGNPIIKATASSSSTEVSVFFMCNSATNYSECSVQGETPDGTVGKGCRGKGTASITTSCSGLDESGMGYVRVRKAAGAAACVSYTLDVNVR